LQQPITSTTMRTVLVEDVSWAQMKSKERSVYVAVAGWRFTIT
jgi:hypothetical protein